MPLSTQHFSWLVVGYKNMLDELTLTYIFYSFFLFYITKWMKDFEGSSQGLKLFLTFFAGLGTFYGLGMLIYIGYSTSWMLVLKVFGITIISTTILIAIEAIITSKIIPMNYAVPKTAIISFFVVPIAGYRLLVLSGLI